MTPRQLIATGIAALAENQHKYSDAELLAKLNELKVEGALVDVQLDPLLLLDLMQVTANPGCWKSSSELCPGHNNDDTVYYPCC